jgi:hypothetical protein
MNASTASAGPGKPDNPDDQSLLDRVRSLFEVADPMPAGLVDRVRLTVSLASLGAEVAELTTVEDGARQPREQAGQLALARGAPEESRTITFDSSTLTIMIRIDSNPDGTARLDGWLAPPRRCQVKISLMSGSVIANADEDGRFAFRTVPRGTVRLVVGPPGQEGSAGGQPENRCWAVMTPTLILLAAR